MQTCSTCAIVWGPFNKANCGMIFLKNKLFLWKRWNLLQKATWEAAAQFIFQPQYTDNLTTSVKEPLQKQFKVASITICTILPQSGYPRLPSVTLVAFTAKTKLVTLHGCRQAEDSGYFVNCIRQPERKLPSHLQPHLVDIPYCQSKRPRALAAQVP